MFDRLFNPEATLNDLNRIVEGPEEIDSSDHSIFPCDHFVNEGSVSVIICRPCFKEGYERARAVASGAFMISQDPIEHIFGNITLYFITVIFEAEACLEFETRKENFYFYSSAEVKLTLRYLSLHSADVDPRMICMNPDLYWSIIIHYGSITKALKVAGGQMLYDIGFGGHDVDFQIQHSSRASLQLSSSLISNHFVSKFTNKDMELRYCCSKPCLLYTSPSPRD